MFLGTKNTYQLVFTICFFIVLSAAITISITIYSIYKTAYEGSKELVLSEAENISDSIEKVLSETAASARAISLAPTFVQLLKNESELGDEKMEAELKKHLGKFKSNFDYSRISLISHATHRYYTEQGFNKIVDPQNDKGDLWYKAFLDLNTSFDFSMGFDATNERKWTLFTNVRVFGDEGEFLGVAGFGRDLEYLKEILIKLELAHKLRVYFINKYGEVVLGTETKAIKDRILSNEKRRLDEKLKFSDISDNFVVTRYIKSIGWSLVIEKKKNIFELLFNIVKINIYATLVMLATILIISSVLIHKRHSHLINLSQKDALTGILNRKAGEEKIIEIIASGKKGMFCLLDADKFKAINDTYGHSAGDEVIKKIASTLSMISRYGDVAFRLGGDEFGLFATGLDGKQNAQNLINRLFEELNKERLAIIENKSIELSSGASFLSDDDDFISIYKRADKALYESKKINGSALTII